MQRRKIKNRESDGTLSFDGFRWMGGRNNQPKVSQSDGIYLGEAARRVITMGEDAVTCHIVSAIKLGGK